MAKNKGGRKFTGRVAPLYLRVSKLNKQYVREMSTHAESDAHLVDTLLTFVRRNMSRTKVKMLLNGRKTGNAVSAKVSKETRANS